MSLLPVGLLALPRLYARVHVWKFKLSVLAIEDVVWLGILHSRRRIWNNKVWDGVIASEAGGYLLASHAPLEVLHLHRGVARVALPSAHDRGLQVFEGRNKPSW